MRILERVAQPITADADGIAVAQTLAGAGPFNLNGASVKANDGSASYDIGYAVLDPPRRLIFDSVGNDSGVDLTIVGLDRIGNQITEILAGGNAGTVTSRYVYSRVISVEADGATAADVEIGWGTESITSWIVMSNMRESYNWLTRVFFPAGGTVNYDLEVTSDPLLLRNSGDYADDVKAVAAAQAGNLDSSNDAPWAAIRLRVNSSDEPVTLRVIRDRTA